MEAYTSSANVNTQDGVLRNWTAALLVAGIHGVIERRTRAAAACRTKRVRKEWNFAAAPDRVKVDGELNVKYSQEPGYQA